jgi:hypothetical protein
MQGPMGILTYLDFVYGGGRGSGAPLNGALDTVAAPLLVKANAALAAGNFAVNDIFYVDTAAAVATGTSGGSYELTFVGNSRIDGFPIFRVRANTTAITPDGGVPGAGHNVGFIFAQGGEGAANALYNCITDGGNFHGAGAGAPLNAVLAGGNVLGTFATPNGLSLVKALEDHITGFSGNALQPVNDPSTAVPAGGFAGGLVSGDNPFLRGVGESTVDNVMGLSLFNKSVAADTFQVAAAVTREQVQDLKQFGIDAVAQIEAVLVNELTQSINKYILDRIFRNGVTNATNAFAVNGTVFSDNFALAGGAAAAVNLGPSVTNNAVQTILSPTTNVSLGGTTIADVQRRIYTKILAASNLIATRGRRGPATFAVTGGEMATALQSVAGFIAYPLSNTVNQAGGSLYPIGAIAGVTIYVDPNRAFNDLTICVGRKGDGNSPGLVFMPYLMAESVETIAEGTMAPKIAVKSRFALVDAGFNPELMYYTMNFTLAQGVNLI